MIETRYVSNWSELQDAMFAGAWNVDLGRFRSPICFRGLSDASYRLDTTLMRLGGAYATLERHLLRNFRKYAHRRRVEAESIWHWIAIAQHHGLPTRLMDWTFSPFVAMHFATSNVQKMHTDGVIWAVDYVSVNRSVPEKLSNLLREELANVFTVEMLAQFEPADAQGFRELVHTLDAFDNLSEEKFLLFFEPPSLDDRIVNQYGLFSVLSANNRRADEWLDEREHPALKIIIPAALKWEIRDKLDQANVTERVLFPGLEGLSRWLRRHYSPKLPDSPFVDPVE